MACERLYESEEITRIWWQHKGLNGHDHIPWLITCSLHTSMEQEHSNEQQAVE
jgi:hypothetical protein